MHPLSAAAQRAIVNLSDFSAGLVRTGSVSRTDAISLIEHSEALIADFDALVQARQDLPEIRDSYRALHDSFLPLRENLATLHRGIETMRIHCAFNDGQDDRAAVLIQLTTMRSIVERLINAFVLHPPTPAVLH